MGSFKISSSLILLESCFIRKKKRNWLEPNFFEVCLYLFTFHQMMCEIVIQKSYYLHGQLFAIGTHLLLSLFNFIIVCLFISERTNASCVLMCLARDWFLGLEAIKIQYKFRTNVNNQHERKKTAKHIVSGVPQTLTLLKLNLLMLIKITLNCK